MLLIGIESESKMQSATTLTTAAQSSTNGVAKPDFAALPIGEESFAAIRNGGKIYVDKTELIATLTAQGSPIFMARPHRFGKSLLCSTLADLFAHGTKNFKGLAIEKLWHEPRYPVLSISFANCTETNNNASFASAMYNLICNSFNGPEVRQHLQEAAIDLADCERRSNSDALQLLSLVLTQYHFNTGKQFVVIIDDFDRMLDLALNDEELFESRVDWLSCLLNVILDAYSSGGVRFFFFTGVTRYRLAYDCNNFRDLTYSAQYSSLFGYTEEELQQYFGPFIAYGAQVAGMSPDEYLRRLRYEYGGYCFSDAQGTARLYHPQSIVESFAALGRDQANTESDCSHDNSANYTDTTFLSDLFQSQLQHTRNKGYTADLLGLIGTDLTTSFLLPASRLTQPRNPYNANEVQDILTEMRVALTKAGYYTVNALSPKDFIALSRDFQSALMHGDNLLFVSVPNHEAAQYLQNDFWPKVSSMLTDKLKPLLVSTSSTFQLLIDGVYSGDPNKVITGINQLFSLLSVRGKAFTQESTLRGILAFLLRFDQSVMEALPVFHALPDPSQTEFVFCPPYKSDTETQEVVPFAADDSDDTDDAKDTDNQVLEVSEEKLSPHGYADIFVATARMNLVFELKLDKSTAKDQKAVEASYDKKLNEALEQIKTRRYYDQFPVRDTWCYAVVFSNKTLRAERLAVFKHTTNGSNSEVRKADPLPPL